MNAASTLRSPAEPHPSTWLDRAGSDPRVGRTTAAWFVALLAHGALVAAALELDPVAPPLVSITEVELLEPPVPPPPPPAPLPEPPPPAAAPPQPRAERRAAPRPSPAPEPPPPASAAPLRTIDESVATADEPVRFVTDPNGSAFGYGTVQRGGTAASAPSGAALPAGEALPPKGGSGTNPLLSRAPQLGESEPCRGFFPSGARVDRGEVTLKVRIEADGKVRSVAVSREAPVGHGFGFAARDCLLSKRFSPALDRSGVAVSVVSPVTVRFSR